ncbi:MAG: hypothetical protein H6740_12500 [Alphaproteobacteria bacterium]|nr:hypothetical protein [Alphaproteobacteria bacterium]
MRSPCHLLAWCCALCLLWIGGRVALGQPEAPPEEGELASRARPSLILIADDSNSRMGFWVQPDDIRGRADPYIYRQEEKEAKRRSRLESVAMVQLHKGLAALDGSALAAFSFWRAGSSWGLSGLSCEKYEDHWTVVARASTSAFRMRSRDELSRFRLRDAERCFYRQFVRAKIDSGNSDLERQWTRILEEEGISSHRGPLAVAVITDFHDEAGLTGLASATPPVEVIGPAMRLLSHEGFRVASFGVARLPWQTGYVSYSPPAKDDPAIPPEAAPRAIAYGDFNGKLVDCSMTLGSSPSRVTHRPIQGVPSGSDDVQGETAIVLLTRLGPAEGELGPGAALSELELHEYAREVLTDALAGTNPEKKRQDMIWWQQVRGPVRDVAAKETISLSTQEIRGFTLPLLLSAQEERALPVGWGLTLNASRPSTVALMGPEGAQIYPECTVGLQLLTQADGAPSCPQLGEAPRFRGRLSLEEDCPEQGRLSYAVASGQSKVLGALCPEQGPPWRHERPAFRSSFECSELIPSEARAPAGNASHQLLFFDFLVEAARDLGASKLDPPDVTLTVIPQFLRPHELAIGFFWRIFGAASATLMALAGGLRTLRFPMSVAGIAGVATAGVFVVGAALTLIWAPEPGMAAIPLIASGLGGAVGVWFATNLGLTYAHPEASLAQARSAALRRGLGTMTLFVVLWGVFTYYWITNVAPPTYLQDRPDAEAEARG